MAQKPAESRNRSCPNRADGKHSFEVRHSAVWEDSKGGVVKRWKWQFRQCRACRDIAKVKKIGA